MRFASLLFLAAILPAPQSTPSQTLSPAPQNVSLCKILKNPKAYDGKAVRFRGQIVAEFEDFTVYDVSCVRAEEPGVWLMFGGDVDCPTPSTWNDVGRPKGRNVKFDGVEYSLVKDESFRKFHKAITSRKNKKPVYQVTATLEGTFFAGNGETKLPGYGHLGCCYLFMIHQINDVDVRKKPTA